MKDDPQLSQLLQAWQVSPSVEAHFRQGVWNRISVQDRGSLRQFLRACKEWCVVSLPKPAYASAFVLLFVLSGATIAETASQKTRQEQRMEMEQRYVSTIDPVAMADQARHPRP